MAKKPSMGRQKIKIAKIAIKNHLQVTFSKRRSGLFKKASELCTLCNVDIAIIVFSPAGKVFSFGHPNVESIIDRYLTQNPKPGSSHVLHLVEAHRSASVCELNSQLTHVLNDLEAERKRGEALENMRKARQSHGWWEAPIEELALHELQQLRDSMEELKKSVSNEANKLLVDATNTWPQFLLQNGGGSNVLPFETIPNQLHHVNGFGFGYGHGFF